MGPRSVPTDTAGLTSQTSPSLEEDHADEKWFVKVYLEDGGVPKSLHRYLMCKGVEWAFQYHNFYGDWELSQTETLCNNRPHYVHNTMYGGHAHLFHTIDPHYHVPRWVIGSAPGNENGWAFCESDAPTPHEVQTTWISWDGFEWHSCKSFRYVPKEHEMDGLSDEDDFSEDDEDEEGFGDANLRGFGDSEDDLDSNGDDAKRKALEEFEEFGVKMTLEEFEEMNREI